MERRSLRRLDLEGSDNLLNLLSSNSPLREEDCSVEVSDALTTLLRSCRRRLILNSVSLVIRSSCRRIRSAEQLFGTSEWNGDGTLPGDSSPRTSCRRGQAPSNKSNGAQLPEYHVYASVQELLVRGEFSSAISENVRALSRALSNQRRNFAFKIIKQTGKVLRQLLDSEEVSERARLRLSVRPQHLRREEVSSDLLGRLRHSDQLHLRLRPDSGRPPRLEEDCLETAVRARSDNLRRLNLPKVEVSLGLLLHSRQLEVFLGHRQEQEGSVNLQLLLRPLLSVDSVGLRTSRRRQGSRSVATTRRLQRVQGEDCLVRPRLRRVNPRIRLDNLPLRLPGEDCLDRVSLLPLLRLRSVSVSLPLLPISLRQQGED